MTVTYRAKLVVLHDGKTMAGGHYTVLRVGTDGTWYHVNGDMISEFEGGLRDVGCDAYIVLYERVDPVVGGALAGVEVAPFPLI